MNDGEWYYCLKHQAVEPYEGCRNDDRLGPYASYEDASNGLAKLHDRNEVLDAAEAADSGEDHDWGPLG